MKAAIICWCMEREVHHHRLLKIEPWRSDCSLFTARLPLSFWGLWLIMREPLWFKVTFIVCMPEETSWFIRSEQQVTEKSIMFSEEHRDKAFEKPWWHFWSWSSVFHVCVKTHSQFFLSVSSNINTGTSLSFIFLVTRPWGENHFMPDHNNTLPII